MYVLGLMIERLYLTSAVDISHRKSSCFLLLKTVKNFVTTCARGDMARPFVCANADAGA